MHNGRSVAGSENWGAISLLLGASVILVIAQVNLSGLAGLWIDELFSLWASDPSLPFLQMVYQRLLPDSNPPLYFILLYWVRQVISDDHVAILALNAGALAAAAAAVYLPSRRADMGGLALLGISAFMLSGPIMRYMLEGRTYVTALSLTFVASWYVALTVVDRRRIVGIGSFALLGALAPVLHVYAGILCGGLAAALLVLAMIRKRPELVSPGLALGLAACLSCAVWIAMASATISGWPRGVSWIPFTQEGISAAFWYVKEIAIGERPTLLLLAGILVAGSLKSASACLLIVFGSTLAVFIALPLLASFRVPMIDGRYWMVGAPALISALLFLLRDWSLQGSQAGRLSLPFLATIGSIAFLIGSSLYGYAAAQKFTAEKPVWKGAFLVKPLLRNCPAGSVRVGGGIFGSNPTWGFSRTTGAPPSIFLHADVASTEPISPTNAACPVIGWAEHVNTDATDASLLGTLKIHGDPNQAVIVRHGSGFVVLKQPQ